MRCRYCGQELGSETRAAIPRRATVSVPPDPAATVPGLAAGPRTSRLCGRCAALRQLRFVTAQGDGETGFREIMIAQHANEPRRKLLETRAWHFTVFLGEHGEITGFELTDADDSHVLRWQRGHRPGFYRLVNVGKGYHNHDELRVNGVFHPEDALAELDRAGANVRPEIRAVLQEGIRAYGGPR